MENKGNDGFNSLEEKCQYYITEYETYKLKYISLNIEYERLLENNKKLYENVNHERKLRKELEEKSKYTNLSYNNDNKNNKGGNFQDDFVILERDMETSEEELFNICNEFKSKHTEIIKIISFSILSKIGENQIINEDGKQKNENEKIINLNNNIQIKNNNFEPQKELITENILSQDFINYSKESISLFNSIYEKELKIDKIFVFLQKLCHYLKIIKRGANFFNKSIMLFNKNLSVYNTENKNILKEWPILSDFISIILKSFSTINIYCSSLIMTIESSCIIQIKDIIENNYNNLINMRNKLKTKKSEFIIMQNNFFANKNFEKMKTNYYNEYKLYELAKYNYFSTINKFLMIIKLKLPEIMSLLIHSYIVYFTTVNKELNQTNDIVRKNLEILLNAINIKNKIENDINTNRKKIIDEFQLFDKTKIEKEGFLFLKEKDSGKFSKRYVKIVGGHLIYYKIKKNFKVNFQYLDNKTFTNIIDNVDTEIGFDICKLLFSNVKKYEKNSSYPFCFEVNVASTKTGYIFQADTEYEMEEWISAITNSISNQISDFNENKSKEKNDNKITINNTNFLEDENEEELNKLKNKNLIDSLIENNICSDCGAVNPNWLSINWLTLLCVDCSGIHRSLGVQISKIRSLELDNINIDYIYLLFLIKQTDINQILEEKLNEIGDLKPIYNDSRENKEKFIINKYKNKKYMNIQNDKDDYQDIIINIFDNIKNNNLINVYKFVILNHIDLNSIYSYNGEDWGFVHYSAKNGNLFMIKLFYILGADITLKDKRGLKPIEYVNISKQKEIFDYLKEKDK